jgi:oligopeptide transport system permease protein
MLHFLLRKLLRVSMILLGVMLITFLLMHAIPGDPWSNYSTSPRLAAGSAGDLALQRELNRRFGLELPKWRQFIRYVIGDFGADGRFFCGVACGNLGPSIQQRGRPVQDVLFSPPDGMSVWKSRFGYSIRLVLFASLIAAGIGIPLGVWSATRPGALSSRAISVGLAALVSIPNFVLGLLAIVVLASWLKLITVLPDWDRPSNWIVPAIVLAAVPMAGIARVTLASVTNVLHEDYIRTARGKGLEDGRVIYTHMLRNASVPIITFLGPTLMELFTGLLIVENLYSFPGFGRGFWQAVLDLDYPMIMGLTLLFALGIVLANTLIEVLCGILDPRLRSIQNRGAR